MVIFEGKGGVSNQWKLSAIDAIEMNSTALVQEELDRLMNLLIDNEEIREILVKHSNNKHMDKTIAAAVRSSKIGMRVLQ
jgi:hypothetical protein